MTVQVNFIRNLILFCIVCILCFFIGEITLRLIKSDNSYNKMQEGYFKVIQKDEILHHSLKPNISSRFISKEFNTEIKINSLGLRDNEISIKNRTRILMLGDSFTFGYGVEMNETFSELIEQNSGYEVINAGVMSYSPILEYRYLKKKGYLLKPDIVIQNIDISDFSDDIRYFKNEMEYTPAYIRIWRWSWFIQDLKQLILMDMMELLVIILLWVDIMEYM